MEVIKKTLPVEDAPGWYLLQDECRHWTEDFVDGDTNEVVPVERSKVVCGKGCKLTFIDIDLLKENGITSVSVSNILLKGNKTERMSLWETRLKIKNSGGEKKKTYIVTAENPTDAETFISDYLEANVECTFESLKVSKLDYNMVIKLYDTEREEYENEWRRIRWYKAQVYSLIAGVENGSVSAKNILVQATDFETALKAVKAVLRRDDYVKAYDAFKSMQELNVEEVFIPDKSVYFYSNKEL